MKVSVDLTKCRGHALCLGIAPEAFDFDDLEEHSIVREGAELVSADLLLAAARECPERAISVEEDTAGGSAG
jgi:ferredoxin